MVSTVGVKVLSRNTCMSKSHVYSLKRSLFNQTVIVMTYREKINAIIPMMSVPPTMLEMCAGFMSWPSQPKK